MWSTLGDRGRANFLEPPTPEVRAQDKGRAHETFPGAASKQYKGRDTVESPGLQAPLNLYQLGGLSGYPSCGPSPPKSTDHFTRRPLWSDRT